MGSLDTRSTALRTIVTAWLVVGILDISSAIVIAETKGRGTIRMLQGLASGLLGERSFAGGPGTAALGLAIHFFIALVVTSLFYWASGRLTFLKEHPFLFGPLYGIGVYLVMYWIVIPLVFPKAHASLNRDITAICIHMLLIGLPTALIVRKFAPSERSL